jgi:hypothetical protein
MEFYELSLSGREVLGLISRPTAPMRSLILHVHGYGGDLMSNRFVRVAHSFWPSIGYGFLSLKLPTSHYVAEQYDDRDVVYCGSALSPPSESVELVRALIDSLTDGGLRVGLQGHSFGTNLVKTICDDSDPKVDFAIYLSPADSAGLQTQYASLLRRDTVSATRRPRQDVRPWPRVVWDRFGIVTDMRSYSIPVDEDVFTDLIASEEFNAWSSVDTWRPRLPSLVVVANGDGIAQAANFSSRIQDAVERSDDDRSLFVSIAAASHSFEDSLDELFITLSRWAGK